MNTSGGQITWTIDADKSRFEAQLAAASASAKALGNSVSRLGADMSRGLNGSLGSIGSQFGTAMSAIGEDIANLGRKIASITWTGIKIGALGAVAAVGALGGFAIKTASDLQAMQISMIGLTKSANLGKEAMAGAFQFAQKSPFQLKEVAGTTKSLIAYGMSAQDAVKSLDLLGNISITSGIPIEEIGNIFGRVSAQSTLMLQDIRQLTERGVAILPALQKQLGKTAKEVTDMATNGEISFEQFRQAMEGLVDPQVLAMLENTLPRQFDRLKGSLRILGFAFIGTGVDAVNGFSAAKDGIYQATVDITRSIADLLRSPSVTAAATAIGGTIAIALAEIPKFIDNNRGKIDSFFNGIAKFFNDINAVAKQDGIKAAFSKVGEGIGDAIAKIDFKNISSKAIDGLMNALKSTDFQKYSAIITSTILGIFLAIDYVKLGAGAVEVLAKAIPGIITGFIQGLYKAATDNPVDTGIMVAAIGFTPDKIIQGFASAIAKISFVGPIVALTLKLIKDFTKAGPKIAKAIGTVLIRALVGAGAAAGGAAAAVGATLIATILGVFWVWDNREEVTPFVENLFAAIIQAMIDLNDTMVQLGLDILGWIIEGFASGVIQFFTQGAAIVQSIVNGIGAFITQLWQKGSEIVQSVINGIAVFLVQVFQKGSEIVQNVINGIGAFLTTVWNKGGEIVTSVINGIGAFLAQVWQKGMEIVSNIANGISAGISWVINAVSGIIGGIIGTISGAIGQAWQKGSEIVSGVGSGISSGVSAVTSAAQGIVNSIKGFFAGAGSWLLDAGGNIIEGLIDGIKGMAGAAAEAAAKVAKEVERAAKNALGIKSPSQVFMSIGRNVSAGLAQGISQASGMALSATSNMANSLSSAMNAEGTASMSMAPGMSSGVAGGSSANTYHIGTINIASEVDGERWLQKLTRDQEIVSNGMIPSK